MTKKLPVIQAKYKFFSGEYPVLILELGDTNLSGMQIFRLFYKFLSEHEDIDYKKAVGLLYYPGRLDKAGKLREYDYFKPNVHRHDGEKGLCISNVMYNLDISIPQVIFEALVSRCLESQPEASGIIQYKDTKIFPRSRPLREFL